MKRRDIRNVAFGVLLCAALIVPLRAAVVDDTFIHLRYARNLARTGELAFNRGEPSYGATSPLWVALLALCDRSGAPLVEACRVLAWLFAAASIALVYRLAAALDGRTGSALACALILAAEAWFVRWTAVAMETSFAVFMVLAVLNLSLSASRSAARSAVFGFVLFLAALSRPEAVLLVPLAAAAFLFARGPRRRFAFVPVFAVLFAAWLVVIHRHTGSYFPLTAGAKQGRHVISAALFGRLLVPARIMGATIALPCLALVAGLVAGLVRRRSIGWYFSEARDVRAAPTVLLSLLWVCGLPAAYAALDFQVLSRYLVPVVPPAIVLGVIAWRRLWARPGPASWTPRAALAVFAAVAVVQSVCVYEIVVVPSTLAFSQAVERTLAGMGRWLDANAPADALVASPDIGAVGWYSHRRILDLGGLVSSEINRMRRSIDVERIIEEGLYLRFHPDYLVDRSETPARFAGDVIRGVRFTSVLEGISPNLGIRKPEPVVYVLYRLDPVGGDGE
jgi:arabinofuranosyltransferase